MLSTQNYHSDSRSRKHFPTSMEANISLSLFISSPSRFSFKKKMKKKNLKEGWEKTKILFSLPTHHITYQNLMNVNLDLLAGRTRSEKTDDDDDEKWDKMNWVDYLVRLNLPHSLILPFPLHRAYHIKYTVNEHWLQDVEKFSRNTHIQKLNSISRILVKINIFDGNWVANQICKSIYPKNEIKCHPYTHLSSAIN